MCVSITRILKSFGCLIEETKDVVEEKAAQ